MDSPGDFRTEVLATARRRPPVTRRAPAARRWLAAGAWTLATLAAFAAYLQLARTRAVNSDGASQALQAWDMLHGNPLLRGWTLTDVSFYTTELPVRRFPLGEIAAAHEAAESGAVGKVIVTP